MKKITTYQDRKVLVLGLVKSSVSAAKLLHESGMLVIVNDAKRFDRNPDAQDLLILGIRAITGGHPIELLDEEFELVVKNPDIPYTDPLVAEALIREIPIITEVELAGQIAECPIVGITSINGRTTMTTMVGLLLNADRTAGEVRLAGNIGFPASTMTQEVAARDDLVVELSSFQLMGIETFHPQIAVITSILGAHLDYHGSREEYVAAKWSIQKNMTAEDTLILNWNQVELQMLVKTTTADVLPFSTREAVEGAYLLDGKLYFNEGYIMPADELGIPGNHSIENVLAAVCVAKLKSISNAQIR